MANFNLNKVFLGGRLTANPELKQTPNGVMVATFSIAIDRKYMQKGEDGQQTRQADFINIVAWRSTAEFIAKYFNKGSSICIIGSIQTRNYTDKEGNKRYITEVVADEASFVDSKSDAQRPVSSTAAGAAPAKTGSAETNPYSPDAYADAPQFEVLSENDELPF